jgi:2-hydroxy-6-oxonona-2,4-dienedioate hydrolase
LRAGPVGGASMSCKKDRVTMNVAARGTARFPAAVIFSGAKNRAGENVSAVAWAALPVPDWESAMADAEAKFIAVNGYRTRYFEAGAGEDVVILVHGGQPDPISPTAQDWRGVFASLAPHFRVIAFDNLGHGYTDIPKTDAEYENYYQLAADHLAGLIDVLGLQRVHLVGHSQGGWPVTRVALDRPETVKCLVNAGSIMSLGGAAGKSAAGRWAYSLFHINPPDGPTPESLMRLALFESYTWNNLSFAGIDESYRFALSPQLNEAKTRMGKMRMSPGHPVFRDLRDRALNEVRSGGLPMPHLLIWGANDQAAPMAAGMEFLDIAVQGGGRVNMHVISQAGHRFFNEYPEEFAAAVLGFCAPFRADH